MRNIKTLFLLFLISILATPVLSQDKQEHKIKVRIETEEDGKKKVFERTYSSKEEMFEDEELQELGLHDEGEHLKELVLTKSDEDRTEDVEIDVSSESEGEKFKLRKVVKDKDGEEKVIERAYNSKEEMAADEDIDVQIDHRGDDFEKSDDDQVVEIEVIKKSTKDRQEKVRKTITIEIEEDDDGKKKKKKVEVVEEERNR